MLLKLELDCAPDAAWRALRSPEVFQAVAAPLLRFRSLEPGGFPEQWPAGEHPLEVRVFGVLPAGSQTSVLTFERRGDIRLLHDHGYPERGPLLLVTYWHHTMAVSPAAGGRTLFRDRLEFEGWLATPFLWPLFWALWQWRGRRLRALAPTWSSLVA